MKISCTHSDLSNKHFKLKMKCKIKCPEIRSASLGLFVCPISHIEKYWIFLCSSYFHLRRSFPPTAFKNMMISVWTMHEALTYFYSFFIKHRCQTQGAQIILKKNRLKHPHYTTNWCFLAAEQYSNLPSNPHHTCSICTTIKTASLIVIKKTNMLT